MSRQNPEAVLFLPTAVCLPPTYPLSSLKPFSTLAAVAGQRVFDDWVSVFGRLKFVDFNGLTFQLLVVLEETPQHRQPVRRHLRRFAIAVEFRILRRNGDDLVIL